MNLSVWYGFSLGKNVYIKKKRSSLQMANNSLLHLTLDKNIEGYILELFQNRNNPW